MRTGLLLVAGVFAGTIDAPAQTLIDLRSQVKNVDFSGALSTKPFRSGVNLPLTCSVSEAFLKLNAVEGQNLYICTTTNVWTVQAPTQAAQTCLDEGSTDAYACSLSPAITAYVTGTRYRFRANTINTGAASINFNSLGALTIKKPNGGSIATDLTDGDIRAGQWVECIYDGTNCQMASQIGNASSGGGDMLAANYHSSGSGAPAGSCATAGAIYRDTSSTPYGVYFCGSNGGSWIGPFFAGVKSFNGRAGAITPQSGDYTKGMFGIGNVDNTSDVDKPVSTAQQAALNLKAPLSHTHNDIYASAAGKADGFYCIVISGGVPNLTQGAGCPGGGSSGPILFDNATGLFDSASGLFDAQ